ncbi:ASKHA domain-containing protein [Afifella sp. YEN Y35]|uniref:ASKHA domain-containing protein n=1 Tax=Afifella sp. YEN Y35 TaxID=3388337 RepID=UPI0039DFFFB5
MPSGKRGRFPKGTPVLDAARQLGVYIESVCGGRGICGRCQIEAQEGHFAKHGISSAADHLSGVTEAENRYAEKRVLTEGRRLSCQALVEGDLVVDVPQDVQINRQIVRKRAETRVIERDPATQLCYVEVEEPDMEKPLGDADRLLHALEKEWGFQKPRIASRLLPQIQKLLRAGEWKVTCAVYTDGRAEGGGPIVTAIFPGFHNVGCGLAVDIGSTTIAAHLTSLLSGRTMASAGAPNPQIRFGEDLMSRVSYVMMNPEGRAQMTKAVRDAIGVLIAELVQGAGITADDVLEAVFVGNPIMHHLFLGIDPTELGGAPFALAVSDAVTLEAREIGLPINDGAHVYVLPCIAGHVGADAAAVTLAEGPHRADEMTLVVDVGTNAEIVLGNKEKLVAASSPTGPAFEGAEISGGQRAAPGAIERVRIDRETLEPKIKVIGGDEWSNEEGFEKVARDVGVTGICGSGIIEVVGEMYLAGIIDEDGVIDGSLAAKSERIQPTGRTFSYLLWPGDEAAKSQEIKILQTDIRAIQLAKAALYAGVRLLMDRLGLEQVEAIKLAGAFGSYIDPTYAMVIGLIPDCPIDKVKGVGNAAGTGARMALLNRSYRREIEEVVRQIEKIETAMEARFQEHFVAAMAFPNKVEAFPHLAGAVTLPPRKVLGGGEDGRPRRRGGRRR